MNTERGGGLSPSQDDYFATLAKIDPSPEMARIIEQAKRSLIARPSEGSPS